MLNLFLTLIVLFTGIPTINAQEIQEVHETVGIVEPTGIHYEMPVGTTLKVDGVEYKAFTLKEWKQVGHLVESYHGLWDHVIELEEQHFSLLSEIENYETRLALWQEEIEFQKDRGNQLSLMYDQEVKLRGSTYNSYRKTSWIPWTLVAIESILLGFIGVYAATK